MKQTWNCCCKVWNIDKMLVFTYVACGRFQQFVIYFTIHGVWMWSLSTVNCFSATKADGYDREPIAHFIVMPLWGVTHHTSPSYTSYIERLDVPIKPHTSTSYTSYIERLYVPLTPHTIPSSTCYIERLDVPLNIRDHSRKFPFRFALVTNNTLYSRF